MNQLLNSSENNLIFMDALIDQSCIEFYTNILNDSYKKCDKIIVENVYYKP